MIEMGEGEDELCSQMIWDNREWATGLIRYLLRSCCGAFEGPNVGVGCAGGPHGVESGGVPVEC